MLYECFSSVNVSSRREGDKLEVNNIVGGGNSPAESVTKESVTKDDILRVTVEDPSVIQPASAEDQATYTQVSLQTSSRSTINDLKTITIVMCS